MEFVSRLIAFFFALFFGDSPFAQDPPLPQKTASRVFPKHLVGNCPSPGFEKCFKPSLTSTPKLRDACRPAVFSEPANKVPVVEPKPEPFVYGAQPLPMELYLRNWKVDGDRETHYEVPKGFGARRLGIRF